MMSDGWFSFPRSNYDILCRIVEASSQCVDQILSIDRIAEICDFDPMVILVNLGFLCNVGIYSFGVEKRLTADGVRLALSIRDQMAPEILSSWRRLIDKSGVAKPIFKWIEENDGVDKEEFIYGVAALYGKRLNKENAIGIDRMWAILNQLSYLDLRDGRIVLCSPRVKPLEPNDSPPMVQNSAIQADRHFQEKVQVSDGAGSPVHLHLHIDSNCDPDRIDAILRSVAKHLRN